VTVRQPRPALFAGLFDDAALFPPGNAPMPAAVRGHLTHRLSWYADMIGPFVCHAGRLPALDHELTGLHVDPVEVAVTVPDGLYALDDALHTAAVCARIRVVSVEVPLGGNRLGPATRQLAALRSDGITGYLEIPIVQVREQHVHELAAGGVRLKLRTGGTTIEAFHSEDELARPILACAAERLAFKCTAGLHQAVRHRDPATGFEHHGFCNILLAARVAASTGNAAAVRDALAEQDRTELGARIRAFTDQDIAAARALFTSFGTCSIGEPLHELATMGLAPTAL
jgi:hypothetical protein